jgi:hypothetical protein
MRQIADESALPIDGYVRIDYIRSDLDRHALIHGFTGEIFTRRDGLPWSHPAVRLQKNSLTDGVERTFEFVNTGSNDVYPYP